LTPRPPVLLLTGATGLVGGLLLPRLLAAHPDRRVVLLLRRPEAAAARLGPRVTAVRGDLEAPGLGLSTSDRARLERETTEVVHAAAATRFDLPIERARAVNVEGTRALLELARHARVERFVFASTVYVSGKKTGAIPEAPLDGAAGFLNTYQRSKHEAEDVVLSAAAQVPTRVLRMSTIAGDSRTGEVLQWNYVHRLVRLLPRNPIPIGPDDPDARVDLLPTDWAIDALARLVEAEAEPGAVRHVCAGRDASLSTRRLLDLAIAEYETHPRGRAHGPVPVPRFVPLPEWEEFVEREIRGGDALTAGLLRAVELFLPHLAIRQDFRDDLARRDLGDGFPPCPPAREWFGKVVAHGLDVDWGRRAVARESA
jgi:nucleoside-diphosphate-sugar epimerase